MSSEHKIFISCGDLAGVGWEILKSLILRQKEYFSHEQRSKIKQLVLVSDIPQRDEDFVKKYFQYLDISHQKDPKSIAKILPAQNKKPVFLSMGTTKAQFGEPDLLTAGRSYSYIQQAIGLFKERSNSSLLTLPVSKEMILKSGRRFWGHTEELKKSFKIHTWMCMYHPELSVIPLTNHIPIKKISPKVKKIDYMSLRYALKFFQKFFKPQKPMAWLGLNPHAGEGGKIGKEEFFLQKQLNSMVSAQVNIQGIFSGDAFFTPHFRVRYSLAVACYHDQGLIPFKALYGADGVNITLNLPQLRVSPDHGPAYSLAKSGNVDIKSVLNSLILCLEKGESWISHFSYPQ